MRSYYYFLFVDVAGLSNVYGEDAFVWQDPKWVVVDGVPWTKHGTLPSQSVEANAHSIHSSSVGLIM